MAVALTTTGDATSKPTAIQQSRSRGAPGLHVFTSSAESSTAVMTASTNESPAVKSAGAIRLEPRRDSFGKRA